MKFTAIAIVSTLTLFFLVVPSSSASRAMKVDAETTDIQQEEVEEEEAFAQQTITGTLLQLQLLLKDLIRAIANLERSVRSTTSDSSDSSRQGLRCRYRCRY